MTVDNFCEWKKRGPKEKQPYAIAPPGRELMALTGLWDIWRLAGGETIRSFTIIATKPNDEMAPIRKRMPTILSKTVSPRWLGEREAPPDAAAEPLVPYGGHLAMWPFHKDLGNVRDNRAGLIEAIAAA